MCRDASLKAPPGMEGVVIDRKVFSRRDRSSSPSRRESIAACEGEAVERKEDLIAERNARLLEVVGKVKLETLYYQDGELAVREGTQLSERLLERVDFSTVQPDGDWTADPRSAARSPNYCAMPKSS